VVGPAGSRQFDDRRELARQRHDAADLFNQTAVHYGYLKAMDIRLERGPGVFRRTTVRNTTNYIINEESARKIGYKKSGGAGADILGAQGIIVGVVKNYHINSLHVAIEPLILHMQRNEFDGVVLVRAEKGQPKKPWRIWRKPSGSSIRGIHLSTNSQIRNSETVIKAKNIISKLANYFAFSGHFLSPVWGLFGLAAFTAEQRTKEIGIRKVLVPALSISC
jgi:putative ABC transport system permease protein